METVTNNSSDKKYFTQVCNLIDELDLSPLAIALYFHYKRFSQMGDTEHQGVKFLMKKYRCGSPAIARAKKELVDQGLIRLTVFPAKDARPDEVEILDVWARNVKHFQNETLPVANQQRVANPLPTSDSPVANQRQPRCQSATAPLPISNALNKEEEFKDFKDIKKSGGGSCYSATARKIEKPPTAADKSPPTESRADYLLRKQIEHPHFNVEQIYQDFKRKCGSSKYPLLKDSQRTFDRWLETQDIEFADAQKTDPVFDEADYFAKKYGGTKTNAA